MPTSAVPGKEKQHVCVASLRHLCGAVAGQPREWCQLAPKECVCVPVLCKLLCPSEEGKAALIEVQGNRVSGEASRSLVGGLLFSLANSVHCYVLLGYAA